MMQYSVCVTQSESRWYTRCERAASRLCLNDRSWAWTPMYSSLKTLRVIQSSSSATFTPASSPNTMMTCFHSERPRLKSSVRQPSLCHGFKLKQTLWDHLPVSVVVLYHHHHHPVASSKSTLQVKSSFFFNSRIKYIAKLHNTKLYSEIYTQQNYTIKSTTKYTEKSLNH